MDNPGRAIAYRRLRVPRQHGAALIEPPLAEAGALMRHNSRVLANGAINLHGRRLVDLATQGRAELWTAAQRYTAAYRDVEIPAQPYYVLTGHQPELYHPGVWFKNFALDTIARRTSATPINLIIDNDLPRSTGVLCPSLGENQARFASIAFDAAGHFVPYEERGILDEGQFRSFAQRLTAAIAPAIADPLVNEFWPLVIGAASRTRRIGLAIAQARHLWEERWGLNTLEVPWSSVCDTRTFRWFAAHLLAELPRLHQDYNDSLWEYRRVHRLRSRTHPVADLERTGEWLEAPFWIWAEHDPHRRRMFARRNQECIELSDRRRLRLCLPLRSDRLEDTLEAWESARQSGIKVRSRAIVTTMYARLVLSDLFLHGIGGAKYDQLTDDIIGRFFGVQPPAFTTLTATVLLPIEHENVEPDDVRRVDRQLRELQFHPEKHAPPSTTVSQLTREKQAWIAAAVTADRLGERHAAIARVNQVLQPLVAPLREKLIAERAELTRRLRRQRVANSREYAFCLFPEKNLQKNLLDILGKRL